MLVSALGRLYLSRDIPMESSREARNSVEVNRWCRQSHPISAQEHLKWHDWQAKDPNTRMYAIYSVETEDFLGVCGLTGISWTHRKAEFSLYITPSQRRRGYAGEALSTLVEHGFYDLNLHRIWGEMFDGNPAESLFTSLGMVYEGCLRQTYFKDGRYLDSHIYSIMRDEWKRLRPC